MPHYPHDNIKWACHDEIISIRVSQIQTCPMMGCLCVYRWGSQPALIYMIFSEKTIWRLLRNKYRMSLSFVEVSHVIAIRLEVLCPTLIQLKPGKIKSSDSDHQACQIGATVENQLLVFRRDDKNITAGERQWVAEVWVCVYLCEGKMNNTKHVLRLL